MSEPRAWKSVGLCDPTTIGCRLQDQSGRAGGKQGGLSPSAVNFELDVFPYLTIGTLDQRQVN